MDAEVDTSAATQALRRKDTTKGPPLRILSLDGGGVRGYSMLLILQELMHRTHVEIHGRAPRPQEIPKPCDHFDLIAGTGTGGLIAIMLGRLRLDLETCKEVYIRMTKRVFETDKTFAGIPYRSTLFKASKLEEAIRDCVREHTIFEDEGNDTLATAVPMNPDTPRSSYAPKRSMSNSSRFSNPYTPTTPSRGQPGWGNPNALLYDVRENRTKTAVTAVYKSTPLSGGSILLRSYDSRREPAPEVNCTIWQAGRATAATGLAFKPIQIGQSVFLDEGAGKYNPSPQILDEAMINEYPTREVGVFLSIGTGKRPSGTSQKQTEWWEGFMGGSSMGDFAEARRRLISKIEGCEEIHQYMLREHLPKRGVIPDNYFRINVEVGVGEFGMNEWSRLSDISTNTRRYLAKDQVQAMNSRAASKMARIHRAKLRWDRANGLSPPASRPYSFDESADLDQPTLPSAIELPAEVPVYHPYNTNQLGPQYRHSQHLPQSLHPGQQLQYLAQQSEQSRPPHYSSQDHGPPAATSDEFPTVVPQNKLPYPPSRPSEDDYTHDSSPPPLPPKTPLGYREVQYSQRPARHSPRASNEGEGTEVDEPRRNSPYHDPDGPPPVVSLRDKPQYGVRHLQ